MDMMIVFTTVLGTVLFKQAFGHGHMFEPPSRTLNRNPVDNGLNCGGRYTLAGNGGKCGVCGDPYQGPFQYEAGGIYATGNITRTYISGQNIPVKILITANHRGWFEFRLCVNNDVTKRITHECLNKHLLNFADGSGTRTAFSPNWGVKDFVLVLPKDVTCSQCVLQWKWRTGNSPGSLEEEYYGCSDISILGSTSSSTKKTVISPSQDMTTLQNPVSNAIDKTNTNTRCRAVAPNWRENSYFDDWCRNQCPGLVCPSHLQSFCSCQ